MILRKYFNIALLVAFLMPVLVGCSDDDGPSNDHGGKAVMYIVPGTLIGEAPEGETGKPLKGLHLTMTREDGQGQTIDDAENRPTAISAADGSFELCLLVGAISGAEFKITVMDADDLYDWEDGAVFHIRVSFENFDPIYGAGQTYGEIVWPSEDYVVRPAVPSEEDENKTEPDGSEE